mmetsp:Transcript_32176/g.79727  ORF Transcript_32176/g.79727 Transcript_32176/m.79727 type:complete len:96 (-) Transcript_32176:560-847(-)
MILAGNGRLIVRSNKGSSHNEVNAEDGPDTNLTEPEQSSIPFCPAPFSDLSFTIDEGESVVRSIRWDDGGDRYIVVGIDSLRGDADLIVCDEDSR